MKIIDLGTNHNVMKLCEWKLVEALIRTAEKSLKWHNGNSISSLIGEIPVYLLNEIDMPLVDSEIKSGSIMNFDIDAGNDFEIWYHQKKLNKTKVRKAFENFNPHYENESSNDGLIEKTNMPETEYFGFYARNESRYTQRYQSVYLCPERIFSATGDRFLNNILLSVVTIHMFAHAKMEAGLSEYFDDLAMEYLTYIEEPLASWLTLKYFHSSNSLLADYDAAERFISLQPEEYRNGTDIFREKSGETLLQRWTSEKALFFNKEKEMILKSGKYISLINQIYNELLKSGIK
jgi:hypothetical protein